MSNLKVPIYGRPCTCMFCSGINIDVKACLNPSAKKPFGYLKLDPKQYPLICYKGAYYHFDGNGYIPINDVYVSDDMFV